MNDRLHSDPTLPAPRKPCRRPGRRVTGHAYSGGGRSPACDVTCTTPYRDWEDLLDHLARAAQEEPILLVLDELPELMATSPALPGILRAFLDRATGRTRLRLLLCGSAVRTMWSIQQTRAPLYGRFDLALPVHPFRPHEASLMLPHLSPVDRARVFGIVGGMPLYLTWWRQDMSVTDNVARLACRPGSPLLTEGRLIMLTEVGAHHAAATLYAIAAGKTRHHEIEDTIGADPSRVLERLLEARLIERIIPVTDDPQRSRRRIYPIADNFLAFYLGPLLRYDAVALAEPDRTRVPVLVGEAAWGRRIDARRITAKLRTKALGLTDDLENLRFAVCGREEILNVDPDTLAITAEDIFTPGG